MKKNVTLKDIARETGVHVSTVSRALTPKRRVSMSSEVVQRVREVADAMGYRPNRLASGLRTRRTMSVGIMIPDITNTLFPPIVRGVESVLEPRGYASILVNTDNDPERESRLFGVLLERGVDGIIDAAARCADPQLHEVAAEVPVVTANRQVEEPSLPSVVNDDAGGVRMMVRLLREAGHRNIGHIAGPPDLSTGITRRKAFETTMRDLQLEVADGAIVAAQRYDESEGERCAGILLDTCSAVTAFLCANDRLAIGAIGALRKRGLECPGDISVTGFNDIPILGLIPPGLTTVRILQFDIGRKAAEHLLSVMGDSECQVPMTTVLPVSLVKRGSVAAPKSRNRC